MSFRSASRSQRSVPTAQSAMPSERRRPHAKAIQSTEVAQPFARTEVRRSRKGTPRPGTVAGPGGAMRVAGTAEMSPPAATRLIGSRGPRPNSGLNIRNVSPSGFSALSSSRNIRAFVGTCCPIVVLVSRTWPSHGRSPARIRLGYGGVSAPTESGRLSESGLHASVGGSPPHDRLHGHAACRRTIPSATFRASRSDSVSPRAVMCRLARLGGEDGRSSRRTA